ncbi:hypothetical protein EBT16_01595 [bacterium]|nr:hypothetical protein [bacterium]
MNNISFAEILDGLEKDVFDLVSNLERQINGRLASSGGGSDAVSNAAPAKPFQPKWRGLRGVLRWLWKGHSKDNPDYAHLYGGEAKSESKTGRLTLAEYLNEVRTIDGFAEEICSEVFGGLLAEAFINISDLLGQFKMDFRNIILKYKNLIRSSVPSAPEVAPAASGQRPVAPAKPEEKASKPMTSEPEKASEENPPASVQAPREEPKEKDDVPSPAEDQEDKGDSSGNSSSEPSSARKPKSHSANIGRWFKDAMEAKKKGGDELKPKAEWLNPKGIVKPEKLPWVIAWMGTKSHKDLHKDEDVKSELQAAIGPSFKDFVPPIAKRKSDSLVGYLRKKMPMASDEEFKRLVSELYGSEYEGSGTLSKKSKKDKGAESAQGTEDNKSKDNEKPLGPDIQELRIKTLSSLYDGMDSKEKVLNSIEDKIIEPAFDLMDSDEDAEYFARWWRSFKRERLKDDQEDFASLVTRINSGAMFDDILRNSEVSKKKPEKKIKLRNLMDMLKV